MIYRRDVRLHPRRAKSSHPVHSCPKRISTEDSGNIYRATAFTAHTENGEKQRPRFLLCGFPFLGQSPWTSPLLPPPKDAPAPRSTASTRSTPPTTLSPFAPPNRCVPLRCTHPTSSTPAYPNKAPVAWSPNAGVRAGASGSGAAPGRARWRGRGQLHMRTRHNPFPQPERGVAFLVNHEARSPASAATASNRAAPSGRPQAACSSSHWMLSPVSPRYAADHPLLGGGQPPHLSGKAISPRPSAARTAQDFPDRRPPHPASGRCSKVSTHRTRSMAPSEKGRWAISAHTGVHPFSFPGRLEMRDGNIDGDQRGLRRSGAKAVFHSPRFRGSVCPAASPRPIRRRMGP